MVDEDEWVGGIGGAGDDQDAWWPRLRLEDEVEDEVEVEAEGWCVV